METLTEKIPSGFGNLYCHVDHLGPDIKSVAFSAPGRFFETSVGTTLDALGTIATQLIQAAKGGDSNVR